MSVISATPPNARAVYLTLIILGALAAAAAGSVIGYISYNYVTREELRNPVPKEKSLGEEHAALPAGLSII